MDRRSKSDPFVVVKMMPGGQSFWEEAGRTEIISNTQNPEWVTKILLDYHFEEVQQLRFEIYDCDSKYSSSDSKTLPLDAQDKQGNVSCTLAQIMGSRGQVLAAPLQTANPEKSKILKSWKGKNEQAPSITIRAEEVANVNANVRLRIRAENLDSMDFLGKSDPFLRFYRMNEDDSWVPCFKSEVIKNESNPTWNEIQVSIQQLANGDVYRPLLVECLDYDRSGTHQLIGSYQTSVQKLLDAGSGGNNESEMVLTRDGKSAGSLFIMEAELIPQSTFLDYIAGGTEMSFITAIDFTASNQDPSMPGSLHYVDPSGQQLNQYAQAIISVGRLLEFYDSDKMFPVFGFGGKVDPGQPPSHCFAVNNDPQHPDRHPFPGVAGIIQTYYGGLQTIQLSGPTLFSQVINEAAALASQQTEKNKYFVLLILTDGGMNDPNETREALVRASGLPLSIIIVGVGNEDFSRLEALDSDKGLLTDGNGNRAERDIVQCVAMRDFADQNEQTQKALAKQILAEVPKQFLTYMESKSIPPQPKLVPETIELSSITLTDENGDDMRAFNRQTVGLS